MNIKECNWNKDYSLFIDYLQSIADIDYQKLNIKLGIKEPSFGVKIPELRKIAKEIIKGDYKAFLKQNKHKYYEEIILHGLIIGYIKDLNEAISELNKYINYIDSWATCDTMVANLKIISKNLDKMYPLVLSYLYDESPWIRRVGVVILLNYYVCDDYIDDIIIEITKIKLDDYYVKMAVAWLIQVAYIKYPIKIIDFLRFDQIDDWTHNKAIQKIRESLKVSPKEKEKLNLLKR